MEQGVRVLLVSEDSRTLSNMYLEFSESGYHVELINELTNAYAKIMSGYYDVIVTEIEFSGEVIGIDFIKSIRKANVDTFVLVYSRIDDALITVNALKSGADAYLTRPTNPKIVKAQILSFLKRAAINLRDIEEENVAVYKDITANRQTRTIYVGPQAIAMSDKEYRIVRMLMRADGHAVSKKDIMLRVWGYFEEDNRVVDVYIAKIRSKIGKQKIHTVRGQGYMLY